MQSEQQNPSFVRRAGSNRRSGVRSPAHEQRCGKYWKFWRHIMMQGSGCLSMSGLEVGVAMSQEWQWFDVATPIQIRYSWCHREIRCIALWTTSVGATWLNSTGSENMSRRCIIFGILRQRRGLIRTGTASPLCSWARQGVQPLPCSSVEDHISGSEISKRVPL